MRVACLLVTHLRAKVEMYRHSHLKDAPVVIVDRSPSRARPVVVDCFRSASGVKPGMTLEQAVSRHANAIVLDADEPHYRRVFGQVLSSLQGISDPGLRMPVSARPTCDWTASKGCFEERPVLSPLC